MTFYSMARGVYNSQPCNVRKHGKNARKNQQIKGDLDEDNA